MVMRYSKRLLWFALTLAALVLIPAHSASAQVAEKFDGRPAFAEGTDMGYYIWRDGETWHVRWTTKGVMRHFTGSVKAEGGELKSLKRIDVESESRVLRPGRAPRTVVGPRGRVYARGGRPPVVATREQDKIEKDGDERIRFNARTDDDIDGFDFKVEKKVTSLRFVLEIDGRPRPQLVEVGKDNSHVPGIPFTVQLK
jgi:hypothetical protein